MSSRILVISGSDSANKAGHQRDLRTVYEHNLEAFSVLTAITIQSDEAVHRVEILDAELVKEQISIARKHYDIKAIKIGMLGSSEIVNIVSESVRAINAPVILDPVLAATSGKVLLDKKGIQSLKETLLPHIYCVTPNLPEAEIISELQIKEFADIKQAANKILSFGTKNVIIKGGHGDQDQAIDHLFGEEELSLSSKRFKKNLRGSGCIFGTSLTCNIALGLSLTEAAKKTKAYISDMFL